MLPVWLQAGLWGLFSGSALLMRVAISYFLRPQRAIAAGAILAIGRTR